MPVTALAERPVRYRLGGVREDGLVRAGTLPGEPAITAAWLLGQVPAVLLPWPLLRAGRAGRGPGPDVREAAVLLPSGVPAVGDVEVHRVATDFARHGHVADTRYSNVLLHLVWRDDRPPAERGGPVRLASGALAPTVAIEGTFGSAARLDGAIARGPAGLAEPCKSVRSATGGTGSDTVEAVLRSEGERRLAERVWRAQQLASEVGWPAAWRTLLDRALVVSAGRRPEGPAARVRLADAVTTAISAGHAGDLVRALAESTCSAAGPSALLAPVRRAGLGQRRAREVGWNAMLPVAAALAAAYDDLKLAGAVHRLIRVWPAPPPYGRTRGLAGLLGVTPGDALTAHGLLRMQELWCVRGGCGRCPLSPPEAPGPPASPR